MSYILSGAGFITQRYKKEGTGQKPFASRFVKKLGGLEIFLYFCEDQNVRQMKIREEFKVREMAGEHVIVMPGRGGAADMTRIVSLNPSSMYRGRSCGDASLRLRMPRCCSPNVTRSTPTRPGRMPGGGSRASPNAESWKSR